MNFDKVLTGRRAVREYTSQTVDEKSIRYLIHCAVMAPNAVNQQPWAFIVVRDQDLLEKISDEAKLHMLSTKHENPHADHLHTNFNTPMSHIFYHAPALILISAIEPGPWIVQDCALAAENLMLSAYDQGLGSCWIGFAQSFLNTSRGKSLIEMPDGWIPVAPIIVGHAAHFPALTLRSEPQIRWIN